jgi:hypothetical protein
VVKIKRINIIDMTLTQKQIQEMDKIAGVQTPTNSNSQLNAGKKRAAELRDRAKMSRKETRKENRSIGEKILDFTGGKEVAQGLGQAGAMKGNTKLLEETQKSQIDIQGNILKAIKEKKAKGEDVSRLENALAIINEDIYSTGASAERTLNPNELTGKQVVGDALQLATTASAGKIVGTANKIPIKGVGVGMGALKGATTGAVSGVATGALTGASQGLQENKDTKGILKDAGTGALIGGAGGAILGSVVGGISGGIKASKIKKEGFAERLASPKATPAVKEQALKEGRVTDPGILSKSKIIASKRDKDIAEVIKPYVSSSKTITQNINSVDTGIKEINEGVKKYVKDNKVPFNGNQLRTQLNKGKNELKVIFASDSNAKKTYDAVVAEFMKHVKSKDTSGLLEARQKFDQIPAIKKLLDSQGLGENVKKEIALTARKKANEYIAKLLPTGNEYRVKLLQESKMIEALGNISEKNINMIDKNKLQLLVNEYPILKWIVGGAVGAAGVGVGGAIIGSTD